MSEMSKIFRSYLVSVMIAVLITIAFCGVFTAKSNTETMLFGSNILTPLLPKQSVSCIINL